MTEYTPDSWTPILIESAVHGKIYKILAGWYGGFAGSDSWKLSSGIESIEEKLTEEGTRYFVMPQSSGSTYVVGERTHMSSLMHSVFLTGVKQAEESGEFTIKTITLDELLEAFKQ